jgi:hypothetical protein
MTFRLNERSSSAFFSETRNCHRDLSLREGISTFAKPKEALTNDRRRYFAVIELQNNLPTTINGLNADPKSRLANEWNEVCFWLTYLRW